MTIPVDCSPSSDLVLRPLATTRSGREWNWRTLRPQWLYLGLALPFGIALLALTPPVQAPDEGAHLFRAYQLSMGHFVPIKKGKETGGDLPLSLRKSFARFETLRGHPEEKVTPAEILNSVGLQLDQDDYSFQQFSCTAIHSPLTYVPQALGIRLARQFTSSTLIMSYVGRAFNLLISTGLMFLAIARTPIAKWPFVVLSLTPMTLFLAASLSSDAMTNALSFLFVAQVLHCAFDPQLRVSNREIVVLALFGAAIGLIKQAYFLMPLIFLIIPTDKLGSSLRYWASFAIVFAATLLSMAFWAYIVHEIYSPPDLSRDIDPPRQLEFMLTHPFDFLLLIVRTILLSRGFFEQYIGVLGWLDIRLPTWVVVTELVVILLTCADDYDSGFRLSLRQRVVASGTAVLIGLNIMVIIHLTWDTVGRDASHIHLQGRYFIPIGPLAAIGLSGWGTIFHPAVTRILPVVRSTAILCIPFLLLTSTNSEYRRYFVDSSQETAERCLNRAISLVQQGALTDEAIEILEVGSRLDPHNPRVRLLLGQLLATQGSNQALEHLRASVDLDPRNVLLIESVATVYFEIGEYGEAIRFLVQAQKIDPGNKTLNRDFHSAKLMEDWSNMIGRTLEKIANVDLVERRHEGNEKDGWYVKPNRATILDERGQPIIVRNSRLVWRSPAPAAVAVHLAAPDRSATPDSRRQTFYACSSNLHDGTRVFVFPAPMNAMCLNDEQISWFFQRRLIDLSAAEREREREYRAEHNLRFPLATLPEL